FAGQEFSVTQLPFTELADQPELTTGPVEVVNPLLDPLDDSTEEPELPPEQPFQLLDKEAHQLTEVYQQLRRRRGYRMLFHEAWRQPTGRKSESLPIRIYAGKDYGQQFNYSGDAIIELENASLLTDQSENLEADELSSPIESANDSDNAPFDQEQVITDLAELDSFYELTETERARKELTECFEMEQAELAKQRPQVWQIDGNIHIYTERFRHVETDLVIRFPDTEEVDLRALETTLAADEFMSNLNLVDMPDMDILSSTDSRTNGIGSDATRSEARNAGADNLGSTLDWQYDEDFLTDDSAEYKVTRDVLKYYPLRQSRRIIDSKVHYFDHPLMGMIIQLRAYDPEEAQNQLQ
ncbi:MAG: CsiV family protein, partial [Gammaproteobacteria bacterium]